MKLVIVESPSKCKRIVSILGKDYRCVATNGHFREFTCLKDAKNLKFHVIKSKRGVVATLKKEIGSTSEVILATDKDREGEAIAWHVIDHFDLSLNTPRVVFSEITQDAIFNAFAHPKQIDMNLVRAQNARQILDITIGFTISPMLWKMPGISVSGLSAGRCQIPALRLLEDNEYAVRNSPSSLEYRIRGYFGPYVQLFNHVVHDMPDIELFMEKSKNFDHIYNHVSMSEIVHKPPRPFTTSRLQQMSSSKLSLSPKVTMSIAQSLYEKGLITYMRTDSEVYSETFKRSARNYIQDKYGVSIVMSEHVVHEEAHEAIRPTKIYNDLSKCDKRMTDLYNLIFSNTISSLMNNAIGIMLIGSLSSPNDVYKCHIERITSPGWLVASNVKYDAPKGVFEYFRDLPNGKVLKYNTIYASLEMVQKESHLSEAKLIQELEKKGIGRPSTYASLIDRLQVNYAKKRNVLGTAHSVKTYTLENGFLCTDIKECNFGFEKNKLLIEPIGLIVSKYLRNDSFTVSYYNKKVDIFSYEFTSYMETLLDEVAKGNMNWKIVCDDCTSVLSQITKPQHSIPIVDISGESYNLIITSSCKYLEKDGKRFLFTSKDGKIDPLSLKTIVRDNYRKIGKYVSVRKGQYGDYIYFKLPEMRKPRFVSLNSFDPDPWSCETVMIERWLEEKHGIYSLK